MFRRSILMRNVSLRRLSTVEGGANKGPDSSSAMQKFVQGASQRKEGATTPLWSRLVRDLTPPAKTENINMSKDRREFNRNRPVSQRQGRYGGAAAAPRKPGPKPVAAAASEDEEGAEDQAPRTTFNDDGEEVDADEYEQNELERDERGRYLRKSERDELDHKRKMSGKDFDIETMEDDKDYKDSDPDLERYDIAGRYEEGAKSGGYLEKTAKETDLEFMMHNAFWESYKTDSGYFMDAYKLDNHERTVIPKPRSLKKLLFRQRSNISQAVPVGSVGYANAEVAWSVVHKNIYYSDTQKQSVVDLIGTKTNEVYEYINQGPMSNTWENPSQAYDPVFRYGFRKGIEVIEEEEQEAAIRETHKQSTKRFVQAETDWEQEAVDDEDALI